MKRGRGDLWTCRAVVVTREGRGAETGWRKGLNRVMGRNGKVLDDRYHAHILRTPTEVKRARMYLLQNARKHYGVVGADPYTSTVAVMEPETFLMRRLC